MTETKKLTLDQFKSKVAAAAPGYATALDEEEAYRKFCRKVRQDLKQLREDLGMKQSVVAEILQMSQPGVSKIENGDGDIGLLSICRYAAALGLQPTLSFSPAARVGHEQAETGDLPGSGVVKAGSYADEHYRELAALIASGANRAIPGPVIVDAFASAMSSAMTQSLSTEIAGIKSAFSELNREEAADAEDAPEDKSNVAAT